MFYFLNKLITGKSLLVVHFSCRLCSNRVAIRYRCPGKIGHRKDLNHLIYWTIKQIEERWKISMEIKSVRLSGVLKKEDTGIVFDSRWLRFKTSYLFRKSRRIFIKSRRKLMKSRRIFLYNLSGLKSVFTRIKNKTNENRSRFPLVSLIMLSGLSPPRFIILANRFSA